MSAHQFSDRERRLLELVREPLFVTSRDGLSHGVNSAGLRMTGLTEEQFLRISWWSLIHEADRDAAEGHLADILDHGGTTEPFRIRVIGDGGRVRWIEAQSTVDPDSGLIYTVAHDITLNSPARSAASTSRRLSSSSSCSSRSSASGSATFRAPHAR